MSMEHAMDGRELEVMTGLVNCLPDVHTPEDAELVLEKLLELDPAQFEARQLRRRLQMWRYDQDSSLNKPIIALKIQSILSKADPHSEPRLRLNLAEQALALNPYHHKANMLLVEAARQLGWGQVVTLAYETLCYHYPGNRIYEMELARIYEHHREPEKAMAIYESLLEDDPDDLDAHEALVRVEKDWRDEREAAAARKEPEPLSDGAVEELENQLKDLEAEQTSLREEVNRMSQLDDSTRDMVSDIAQRVDLAHLDLLEAEAVRHPQDLEIAFHLGQAREKVGLFAEACQAYDNLLDDPEAQEDALVAMTACVISRAYQQHAYGVPKEEPPADEVAGHAASLSAHTPLRDGTTLSPSR